MDKRLQAIFLGIHSSQLAQHEMTAIVVIIELQNIILAPYISMIQRINPLRA
jgi:hypothetical protein